MIATLAGMCLAAACGDDASAPPSIVTPVDSTASIVAIVYVGAERDRLAVGESTLLRATALSSRGDTIRGRTPAWSSSPPSVATISAGGTATAVGPGTAALIATIDGASGSAVVSVAEPAATLVASVTVKLLRDTVRTGASTLAVATARTVGGDTVSGRPVVWESSDLSIATVSATGAVTAVGRGTAVIGAEIDGFSGVAVLAVVDSAGTGGNIGAVFVRLGRDSLVAGDTTSAGATVVSPAGDTLVGRPVLWSSSNPSVAPVSATGRVVALARGSATISAAVEGVIGGAFVTVRDTSTASGSVALPELPRVRLDFPFPAPRGRTLNVRAGDNLQQALNQAARGDEVVLAAGATFSGNFILPAKPGTATDGWIVVRSDALASLPPVGTRVGPGDAARMPRIVTPNAVAAIQTAPGTSGWRLAGVEVTVSPTFTQVQNGLVLLGDVQAAQNDVAEIPSDIVLDRVFIHGTPTGQLKRCVGLNSARTAITDSYLGDCHGKGFDSQAIGSWNGPGPFRIANNTLEGAGENILFGGADPSVPNLAAADVEIVRNYIVTPASWDNVFTKKNLLESKNARRVLVEGNVFDGSWSDGQTGFAVVLKSANQSGRCTWCGTTDVTIRNNIFRNVGAGFNLAADAGSNTNPIGSVLTRVLIEHNLMDNVNVPPYRGEGRLVQVLSGVRDLTIRNNTLVSTGALKTFLQLGKGIAVEGFVFRDLIVSRGQYGMLADGAGGGAAALAAARGDVTYANVVVIGPQLSGYPSGTRFVSSQAEAEAVAGAGADRTRVLAATTGAAPSAVMSRPISGMSGVVQRGRPQAPCPPGNPNCRAGRRRRP